MATARAGNETLHEALAQLNEASKERREEIQKLIDDKYTNLRDAFGGAARASADWVKEQGKEMADASKLTAVAVDRSVRRHPWAYVGGAAATGFLLGLLVSRRK
jgi:ElaB/YqjD/DUF883 family membrane-anchored ribosome-binding protein